MHPGSQPEESVYRSPNSPTISHPDIFFDPEKNVSELSSLTAKYKKGVQFLEFGDFGDDFANLPKKESSFWSQFGGAIAEKDTDLWMSLQVLDAKQNNYALSYIQRVDFDGRTFLHQAIMSGNVQVIRQIVRKRRVFSALVCQADSFGRLPLHYAVAQPDIRCFYSLVFTCSFLLSCSFHYIWNDLFAIGDRELLSSVHWCAIYNRLDILESLLIRASHVILPIFYARDNEEKIPLHWCATFFVADIRYSVAKLLLEQGDESNADGCVMVNARDQAGKTTLHLACGVNNFPLIAYLLTHPLCDMNARDALQRTPLHWACLAGHSNVVSWLLAAGADKHAQDLRGASPLHYACAKNHPPCIKEFLVGDEGPFVKTDFLGRDPLMYAVISGSVQALRRLIEAALVFPYDALIKAQSSLDSNLKHVSVNSSDLSGTTVLMIACLSNQPQCVDLLLSNGAIPNASDSTGKTALHYSARVGNTKILILLIGRGGKIDAKDENGESPIHVAAKSGQLGILSLLLLHDANPNDVDNEGRSALHHACINAADTIIRFLLKSATDVNVNLRDKHGYTPLLYAVRSHHASTVSLLLHFRAAINAIIPQSRMTALDVATLSDSVAEEHQIADKSRILDILCHNGGLHGTDLEILSASMIQVCWRRYLLRKKATNQVTSSAYKSEESARDIVNYPNRLNAHGSLRPGNSRALFFIEDSVESLQDPVEVPPTIPELPSNLLLTEVIEKIPFSSSRVSEKEERNGIRVSPKSFSNMKASLSTEQRTPSRSEAFRPIRNPVSYQRVSSLTRIFSIMGSFVGSPRRRQSVRSESLVSSVAAAHASGDGRPANAELIHLSGETTNSPRTSTSLYSDSMNSSMDSVERAYYRDQKIKREADI